MWVQLPPLPLDTPGPVEYHTHMKIKNIPVRGKIEFHGKTVYWERYGRELLFDAVAHFDNGNSVAMSILFPSEEDELDLKDHKKWQVLATEVNLDGGETELRGNAMEFAFSEHLLMEFEKGIVPA